jgi:hypothetical protein
MALILSSNVREKLAGKIPPVSEDEILQCFANCSGRYLLDKREEHRTDPPTHWFLSDTDYGRLLKVVFILKDGDVIIKTAYDPNQKEQYIYRRFV